MYPTLTIVLSCLICFSVEGRPSSFAADPIAANKPTLAAEFLGDEDKDMWVMSLAFSPNGETLAMGVGDSERGFVNLCNVKTKSRIARLKGHEGYVYSIAYSPDGQVLASASSDGTVRLWQVGTGKELQILKGHSEVALCVAISPDGKRVVSGDDDNIYYWDLETGQKKETVKAHQGGTESLAFSPDGKTLASGGFDRTVRLWDVESGKFKSNLLEYKTCIQQVAFSPNGTELAVVPRSFRSFLLCDLKSGQRREFQCDKPIWGTASFSPNGRLLAIGEQTSVLIFDVGTGKRLCRFPAHEYSIYQVAFSPDGKSLGTASSDNCAKLWNVEFLDRTE